MTAEPQVVPTVNQLLQYRTLDIYITPAVMQWHGSNNRTPSLNMAWLNQSDHMRRRSDAASVKHPNGCCRESGFEPWDDTLEQIRIRSASDKLIFWSWVLISRFPALRLDGKKWEKPSHNHLSDYVNIQMILFVDPRFTLAWVYSSLLYTLAQI